MRGWLRVSMGIILLSVGVASGEVLFREDFESGELTRWDIGTSTSAQVSVVEFPPGSGNYALKINYVWPKDKNAYTVGVMTKKSFGSDYILEFDSWAEKIQSRIVINLRIDFNPTSNIIRRTASLWTDMNHRYRLMYRESKLGGVNEIISPSLRDVFDGKKHHWKITVKGVNITVEIDEGRYKFMVPPELVSITEGDYRIGFSALNFPMYYDNVVISTITGQE